MFHLLWEIAFEFFLSVGKRKIKAEVRIYHNWSIKWYSNIRIDKVTINCSETQSILFTYHRISCILGKEYQGSNQVAVKSWPPFPPRLRKEDWGFPLQCILWLYCGRMSCVCTWLWLENEDTLNLRPLKGCLPSCSILNLKCSPSYCAPQPSEAITFIPRDSR